MGAIGVVMDTPRLNLLAGVTERAEPVLIQALVAEPAVERLNKGVLDRPARFDEAQSDTSPLRPVEHGFRCSFRPIVEGNLLRQTTNLAETDDVQNPQLPAGRELIRHEVERPAGIGLGLDDDKQAPRTRFLTVPLWILSPVFPDIPKNRQTSLMPAPSRGRATNRRRSPSTLRSIHGLNASRKAAKSVTHVSGTFRHLSLRSVISRASSLRSRRRSGGLAGRRAVASANRSGSKILPCPAPFSKGLFRTRSFNRLGQTRKKIAAAVNPRQKRKARTASNSDERAIKRARDHPH